MTADELQAGRELDAQIAEKVMGWSLTDRDGATEQGWAIVPDGSIREISHYSTDIAAAWQVIEKVKETLAKWYDGTDYGFYMDYSAGKWHIGVGWEDDREICITADTAPLAICRAALKAKGDST